MQAREQGQGQRDTFTLAAYPAHRIASKAAIVCGFGIAAHWIYAQQFYEHRPLVSFGLVCLAGFASVRALDCIRELKTHLYQHKLEDVMHMPRREPHHGHFLSDSELEQYGAFNPTNGMLVGKTYSGKPIFLPSNHSIMISMQGAGKTISRVVPLLIHGHRESNAKGTKSRAASALVMDVKAELCAMTAYHRKEYFNHDIQILDPDSEETASYNPLDIVMDELKNTTKPEKHRQRAAAAKVSKLAAILKPEPPKGAEKDEFFRLGVIVLMEAAMLYVCDTQSRENATLMRVGKVLFSNEHLETALEYGRTSGAFVGRLQDLTNAIDAMNKYLDTHLLSARMDWSYFTESGMFANVFRSSSFRFWEMKHKPVTIYLKGGRSDKKILKKAYSLIAECFTTEVTSERGMAGDRTINLLLEEATNVAFDISQTLTLLRSARVFVDLIGQSRPDFYTNFGQNATETAWNNTEVKIIDGGLQDMKLAEDISKICGTYPVGSASFNVQGLFSPITHTMATHDKPLLAPNEFAEMKNSRVVIWSGYGNNLCQKATYADFMPWHDWIDPNPEEKGGKLKKTGNIRLKYSRPDRNGWQSVTLAAFNERKPPPRYIRRLRHHLNRKAWAYVTAVYCGGLLFAYNVEEITGRTPHILADYQTTTNGDYTHCGYKGINSHVVLQAPKFCPVVHLLDPLPAYFGGY